VRAAVAVERRTGYFAPRGSSSVPLAARVNLFTSLALAACSGGAGGLETGPKHDPANSPEAASVCPKEWEQAKAAREQAVADETEPSQQAATRAVLAQAECEREALTRWPMPAREHAEVLTRVKEARSTHRDTANLYTEVARSTTAELALAGRLGLGQLHLSFATLLARVPDPTDMPPDEQIEFRGEVRELVVHFHAEAERELAAVVDASLAQRGDAAADALRLAACVALTSIDSAVAGCRD